MPTHLPPPRPRAEKKRPSILSAMLNTFMVVSALALTFMVLVQEQRYANGQPGPLAGTLTAMMQQQTDVPGEGQSNLPPD